MFTPETKPPVIWTPTKLLGVASSSPHGLTSPAHPSYWKSGKFQVRLVVNPIRR